MYTYHFEISYLILVENRNFCTALIYSCCVVEGNEFDSRLPYSCRFVIIAVCAG